MSKYQAPLADRFAAMVRDIGARVQALENRTSRVNSALYIHTRTGVVDPAYTTGLPMVTVTGDTALTGPYPYLASYTPVASDPVMLAPQGAGYVVLGRLVTT